MAGSARKAKKRGDSYHHGRLRHAVLDAALELVDERGVGGFSMREVARRAGVSHNAPYHHFADKGALVEELVAESFEELADGLRDAERDVETPGEAMEKLLSIGVAYVRFALDNPARFRFMFRPELKTSYRPSLGRTVERLEGDDGGKQGNGAPLELAETAESAALAAYRILLDAVVECQLAGSVAPGDPAPLALAAWSTVHGLAVLMLDGPESEIARSAEEADRAAKAVTETLARGLLAR